MMASHLEVLVEELSMEAFLRALLPRFLGAGTTYKIIVHRGKTDLLSKLGARLKGYASWIQPGTRIVVVVDRDDDDCLGLKQKLERAASSAGLRTRTSAASKDWQFVGRIAIEELEAWYFGEWNAVRSAYPRVPDSIPRQSGFRDPDAIVGGTWEAFERVLLKRGYFAGGLRKLEAAQAIGERFDPSACSSKSFAVFKAAMLEATLCVASDG